MFLFEEKSLGSTALRKSHECSKKQMINKHKVLLPQEANIFFFYFQERQARGFTSLRDNMKCFFPRHAQVFISL